VHIGTVQNRFYIVFGRSLSDETRNWKKPMYVTILQAHMNNIKEKLKRDTHISVTSHNAVKYFHACETLW
jgi:hypothetical protein